MNRLALVTSARTLTLAMLVTLPATQAGAQQYLGNLSANPYAGNSTANPYGQYGSKWGNTVNNPYGQYGSKWSGSSANNPYASEPPELETEPGGGIGVYGE
jgi:hypothetical protein